MRQKTPNARSVGSDGTRDVSVVATTEVSLGKDLSYDAHRQENEPRRPEGQGEV